VLLSVDNGVTWRDESDGLPTENIYTLGINDKDSIFAGNCCGYGIWNRAISEMITGTGEYRKPDRVTLSPNQRSISLQ